MHDLAAHILFQCNESSLNEKSKQVSTNRPPIQNSHMPPHLSTGSSPVEALRCLASSCTELKFSRAALVLTLHQVFGSVVHEAAAAKITSKTGEPHVHTRRTYNE